MNSVESHDLSIRLELLFVLAIETAMIVALHLAGTAENAVPLASIADWLRFADPAVVLVALARLVGLIIGYWLVTTTLLYGAAHHLGFLSARRALHWITLPVIRKVVQGVTAASLTSASIVGPATLSLTPALAQTAEVAQDDSTGSQGDNTGTDTDTDTDTGTGTDTGTDGTDVPDAYPTPVDAAGWPDTTVEGDFWRPNTLDQASSQIKSQSQSQSQSQDYTVVRNDHFWKIAEDHLRQTVGRDVTEDEICLYWVRVVDANRATIRSGDPDLIFAAEVVSLPPVFGD